MADCVAFSASATPSSMNLAKFGLLVTATVKTNDSNTSYARQGLVNGIVDYLHIHGH